jgi:dUTP pyrophosphatase
MPLPAVATGASAGLDLRASEATTIEPGRWAAVPTGLAMAVPPGAEIQIRARSGLAFRHGVTVLNGPGTIDADYRGEIKVLLINHGSEPFAVLRGMRIAQAVVATLAPVTVSEVSSLEETDRGAGGFGSTGLHG